MIRASWAEATEKINVRNEILESQKNQVTECYSSMLNNVKNEFKGRMDVVLSQQRSIQKESLNLSQGTHKRYYEVSEWQKAQQKLDTDLDENLSVDKIRSWADDMIKGMIEVESGLEYVCKELHNSTSENSVVDDK